MEAQIKVTNDSAGRVSVPTSNGHAFLDGWQHTFLSEQDIRVLNARSQLFKSGTLAFDADIRDEMLAFFTK
jgi:hypothetical protein